MLDLKTTELLQFDKIKNLIQKKCFSSEAKKLAEQLQAKTNKHDVWADLCLTQEINGVIGQNGFFPSVECDSISEELSYLLLDGTALQALQLLKVAKTTEVCNSLLRYLKNNKNNLPFLFEASNQLTINHFVIDEIFKIINEEAEVKNNASPELNQIRKKISEKKKESDKRFYALVNELRKHDILRENEEGFYNGRRTLAVLAEHKSEVNGLVHGKSESGKTIFIEPNATISINNEIAELEIDESREINRLLRALCLSLKPYASELKASYQFLTYVDFIKAKALFAIDIDACLPEINDQYETHLQDGLHPLLLLQNKVLHKKTVPLSATLNQSQRVIVISGPNAGGKTVALKTIGLLQIMLQSGLLIPVNPSSRFCFFESLLIDIGDTQSIENELSTYSAKLKSMTHILTQANESTLILMDEFGSGTDPELGSAIAETVLESIVQSKAKGIITTHFGKVKLLAEKLNGCVNASMLFDIEKLEPYYKLNIGEPGSSFTFEVAERIGFPIHLINKAKDKINKDELRLSKLLSELQDQKLKLELQQEKMEHEHFVMKMAKEKYLSLFKTWEEKINKERERKIELSHMADYGQKYLRLMDDWNAKKDRKQVIQRFIDGITAETKKQELLKKQHVKTKVAVKKIERIKPQLKIGSKVRVLNGKEIGVVESIKDEKVILQIGLMKLTVGMENVALVD